MDRDFQAQVQYLSSRIDDLVRLCQKEFSAKEVSEKIRNIFQDVATRLRRLLDNVVFSFFEKEIAPTISVTERVKYERGVYFPIVNKIEDLKSALGRAGLQNLEKTHSAIYQIIEDKQPYRHGNEWLRDLRDVCNLGHRKLVPQKKQRDSRLRLGQSVSFGIKEGASAHMRNVLIEGKLVQDLNVDSTGATGLLDPNLNPRMETSISYKVEGTNINIVILCEKSLKEIQNIAELFSHC